MVVTRSVESPISESDSVPRRARECGEIECVFVVINGRDRDLGLCLLISEIYTSGFFGFVLF